MLDNAVKFTPSGGTVDVDVMREGQDAVLRVTDTGIGIEPHMLSRVFELFAQAEQPMDRPVGGLGIGLTPQPPPGGDARRRHHGLQRGPRARRAVHGAPARGGGATPSPPPVAPASERSRSDPDRRGQRRRPRVAAPAAGVARPSGARGRRRPARPRAGAPPPAGGRADRPGPARARRLRGRPGASRQPDRQAGHPHRRDRLRPAWRIAAARRRPGSTPISSSRCRKVCSRASIAAG